MQDELKEFMSSKLNEECGVFGVFNVENASEITYFGLHSLQHRGQEGCGMVVSDEQNLSIKKGEGLVAEIFNNQILSELKGCHAIGHVRYSTAGGGGIENVQPFLFRHHTGDFALAHNGNLLNSKDIKLTLEKNGSIFQSTSDSETLAHLISRNGKHSRIDAIKESLRMIEGGFAFLILTKDSLYACRDKHGLRPLSLARLNNGYVVASETCAFDVIGAKYIRDLLPGEVLKIARDGVISSNYSLFSKHHMCAMEYVYFSRPDSVMEHVNVHEFRKESGRMLARISPVEADIVVGVPDSSLSAALGYSLESGIPYEIGLIKNKYIGRTFIQPSQKLREKSVKMKLSVIESVVKDKRVILIDDSIVRGTTSRRIIAMLKEAGAKEVHVRVASPQITHPCFYGVDISTYEELISARLSLEEINREIGSDSLVFLDNEALYKCAKRTELCDACFTGKYPTNLYQPIEEANKDGKF